MSVSNPFAERDSVALSAVSAAWNTTFHILSADAVQWAVYAEDVHSAIAAWLAKCVDDERGGDPAASSITAIVAVNLTGVRAEPWANFAIGQAYRQSSPAVQAVVRKIVQTKYPELMEIPFLENADYRYGQGLTYQSQTVSE